METLAMSGKERRRLEVLSRVQGQVLTLVKAAELLGICYRQAKRALVRYREQGDAGLVHRRVKAGNVGGHLREHLVDQFSVAAIDARHIAQVQP